MDGLRSFRFSLRDAAILVVGIGIGLAISRVSSHLRPRMVPSEAYSLDLSEYQIEPPDVLRVTVNSHQQTSPLFSRELLVGPDGTVSLGALGQVSVTGLSVAEAQNAMETAIQPSHPNATVTVEVVNYNSKVYSLIHDVQGAANVIRLPFTGNENVLDALSSLGADVDLSQRNIWIARPSPPARSPEILKVNWDAIAVGANRATNYQMLPGDRLIVSSTALSTSPQ